MSFETGASTATQVANTTSNAEAILGLRLNENDTLAIAIGHQDEAVIGSRILMSALGLDFNRQQNPLHLMYGHQGESGDYGLGFFYSNMKNKVSGEAESSSGIQLGYGVGAWRVYSTYTLVNSVESAVNTKFDGDGYVAANIDYTGDTSQFYLRVVHFRAKALNTITNVESTSQEKQVLTLGLTDQTLKEDSQYFWGLELVSTTVNCRILASAVCDKKYTSALLPVWFGIEAEATSRITLRGSIKQTVLINQSKDEVGYSVGTFPNSTSARSDFSAGTNSTVVALGLGFKFSRVMIDGLLSAANTQQINGTNLLTQVGFTHHF